MILFVDGDWYVYVSRDGAPRERSEPMRFADASRFALAMRSAGRRAVLEARR